MNKLEIDLLDALALFCVVWWIVVLTVIWERIFVVEICFVWRWWIVVEGF
jgi:hypothetical protein